MGRVLSLDWWRGVALLFLFRDLINKHGGWGVFGLVVMGLHWV